MQEVLLYFFVPHGVDLGLEMKSLLLQQGGSSVVSGPCFLFAPSPKTSFRVAPIFGEIESMSRPRKVSKGYRERPQAQTY